MNFYPFHIGDYAAHTRNLSLLEDLAYRRLLDAYYLAEHPFNGSTTDVAREIGMRDQVAEVEYILGKFFELDGDVWRNKRADKEIERYREKLEQASRAGKASAERRLNARPTPVAKNLTLVVDSSNGRATNQEPRTKNQSPSLRSGETADKPQALPSRRELKTLEQFLEICKAEGRKPVPLDASVRTYCHDAGIDDEMLQIAWLVFKDRHLNAQKDKRYKDWGKAFANSVKDRWYKLWFDDGEGVKWTATGLQEKRVIEARTAERRAGTEGAA